MYAFRAREGFNLVNKYILNIIQNESRKSLGGMIPLQWLLQKPQAYRFIPKYKTKDGNSLTKIMYLYLQSLLLWKNNCDALLMDFTYKTNSFKMPLLIICGVTDRIKIV